MPISPFDLINTLLSWTDSVVMDCGWPLELPTNPGQNPCSAPQWVGQSEARFLAMRKPCPMCKRKGIAKY